MNKKEKNFISAVVYVHNSEQRIEDFMKMLISTLEEKFEYSEIIIVNDHSADNSSKKIKEICLILLVNIFMIILLFHFIWDIPLILMNSLFYKEILQKKV